MDETRDGVFELSHKLEIANKKVKQFESALLEAVKMRDLYKRAYEKCNYFRVWNLEHLLQDDSNKEKAIRNDIFQQIHINQILEEKERSEGDDKAPYPED